MPQGYNAVTAPPSAKINGVTDISANLAEIEKQADLEGEFYEDIFESQRADIPEYEDYLSDLAEAQSDYVKPAGGRRGDYSNLGNMSFEDGKQYADGDVSKIETILGLDQGYLGENPVVVTIEDISSIRIPSGNELGAWPEYWEPGGYTSGGVKEAVVNPAAEGTYTFEHLFE